MLGDVFLNEEVGGGQEPLISQCGRTAARVHQVVIGQAAPLGSTQLFIVVSHLDECDSMLELLINDSVFFRDTSRPVTS